MIKKLHQTYNLVEVNVMLVFSVSGLRKKLRVTTKILMIGFILFLLVYLINYTYTTLNNTIIVTNEVAAEELIPNEEQEPNYPVEPIRVSTDLNEYLQIKINEIKSIETNL